MNYGIDYCFAQGNGVPQARLNPLFGSYKGFRTVLYFQLIQYSFGCLYQRAITIFVAFYQIHPVCPGIFGYFHGITVVVCH